MGWAKLAGADWENNHFGDHVSVVVTRPRRPKVGLKKMKTQIRNSLMQFEKCCTSEGV
jgi:hypothetical protein